MKITKLRDHIFAVGGIVENNELVCISLNSFSPPWHNFVQVLYGRANLLDFKQPWDAFIGEEMRL